MSAPATKTNVSTTATKTLTDKPSKPNAKPKTKKKKLSGDARRRAKKRKLQAAGGATTATSNSSPATTTATTATTTATSTSNRPKKRNRKNTKCKCSRCGRNIQKKNLRPHLEKCDGIRPKRNPNHVSSLDRKDNTLTDDTLAGMFSKYCGEQDLEGTDADFAAWSETLLENAEDTMKSVQDSKQLEQTSSNKQQKQQQESPIKIKYGSASRSTNKTFGGRTTGELPSVYDKPFQPRHVSTGKKQTFDDDSEEDDEDA